MKIIVFLLFIANYSLLFGQDSTEVKSYVAKLNKGEIEEVRKALPDLITKYQNNPGVIYLQARLASNGIEALKLYQSIVTNFPQSEWADDALYHEYQYYYVLGLYRTAEAKLQQLKREYPRSPFASTRLGTNVPPLHEQIVRNNTREMPKGSERPALRTPPREETKSQKQEKFALQVGAFSTAANAEKQKSFFENKGFKAEITNVVQDGKSYYKVWIGSYRTAEEAKKASKSVKSKYKIESMVVER